MRAGAAAAGVVLQLRRRRMPDLLAGGQPEREKAAGLIRRREDIRHRNIRGLVVGRRAPFDAPERAALPGLELPDDLAFVVGVEAPHDTGLLSDHEDPLAARQASQD